MSTHFLVLQPPQCNTSQTSGIIRVHIQYMYSTRRVCVILFSTVWPNDRSSFPKWPASDWSIYRHPNSWLLTPEMVLISTALFPREGPHFSQQVQVPAYCERHLCIKHRTLKKAQVKIVWQNVPTALSMKSLVAANKWHTYLARRFNHDQEGGSSRVRPGHCTEARLTSTITPNVGNSSAKFLLYGGLRSRLPPLSSLA